MRDRFAAFSRTGERAPPARGAGAIPGVEPVRITTRYEDVRAVLGDPRFVNDAAHVPGSAPAHRTEQVRRARGLPPEGEKYPRAGVFDADSAEPRRLRGLVHPIFTAGTVARLRPPIGRLAEEHARALREHADADGVVDLIAHFGYPLPVTVIGELLGIPEPDRPQWRTGSSSLGRCAGPGPDDALRAVVAAAGELIDRRAEPGDDLVSRLAAAEGDAPDRVETASLRLNLVVAGHETTAALIGNGTAALRGHPEQRARLRAEPALLPAAVDELTHWCGPTLGTLPRHATGDVVLAGTLSRTGEAVVPIPAGADHDPRVSTEPERPDVRRATEPHHGVHLDSGYGAHRRTGAALAREEAVVVAFGTVLRGTPASGSPWPGRRPSADRSRLPGTSPRSRSASETT
ncbi:cytochrome P450 [Kitasatospora sp. NPDC127111]|uniref:cytochrome P450 n=1 Tax=Kitasatospora sp. NPDC127111 TaxID=3345363 RepID=UPI003624CD1A